LKLGKGRATASSLTLLPAVIGAIYLGIATATEAAVGALLTIVIGVLRRRLDVRTIMASLVESLRTSVALFSVLIGAARPRASALTT
jgi:C4-dicarboxylate transporter, DctM subunit